MVPDAANKAQKCKKKAKNGPRWPQKLPKGVYSKLWRFADQRGGPIYKLCCSKAKSCQAYPKSVHSLFKRLQTLPNSSPNPSQTAPKPFQSDPKSIQKASWRASWTNALTRYNFEHPKYRQNAPKSGHKEAQSVSNSAQIETKTFPNQIFEQFFVGFFLIINLHRFLINVLANFTCFFKSRPSKFMRPRGVLLTFQ